MNFSQEQLNAATTTVPHATVLAGAGSGKTRVFVQRIAYLLNTVGVSKETLIICTFTRKAANEVARRLSEEHGIDNLPWLGTMHSVALKFIRQYATLLGYNSERLTVIGQKEFDMVVRDGASQLGIYKKGKWCYKKTLVDKTFNDYFNLFVYPDNVAYTESGMDRLSRLFWVVMATLRRGDALPYGQILVEFRELVNLVHRELYVKAILIDEGQDLSRMQWLVLNRVAALTRCDSFVVGDPDQAIYEWRGADPAYFVDRCNSSKVFHLGTNYRSKAWIVDAANKLISHNEGRITKNMEPVSEIGGEVRSLFVDGHEDVAELMKNGTFGYPEDALVLCRTHRILSGLAETLDANGVPCHQVGKLKRFSDDADFVAFNAMIRLLHNPYDDRSMLIANRLIGIADEELHRQQADHPGEPLSRAFNPLVVSGSLSEKINALALDFLPWPEHDDLRSFIGKICEAIMSAPRQAAPTFKDYLDFVSTIDEQDDLFVSKDQKKGWRLSTIHSAKGLEAENVVVVDCNEGDLPIAKAIKSGDIDAERRLAYVAWTRARNRLWVLYDINRNHSRFIYEGGL